MHCKHCEILNRCNKKGNIANWVHIFRCSPLAILWVQIALLFSFLKIEFSFPRNTLEGTVSCLVDINLNLL